MARRQQVADGLAHLLGAELFAAGPAGAGGLRGRLRRVGADGTAKRLQAGGGILRWAGQFMQRAGVGTR
jgi:hypothetical protein